MYMDLYDLDYHRFDQIYMVLSGLTWIQIGVHAFR